VAYHDPGDRYRTLWVQTPRSAQAFIGDALVADNALVGRLVRATGRYAQALLVHDVESSVDVVSPDGTRGIIRGTGGPEGRLYFVPRYEPLEVGARLITTGRDATFPADVPVAVVASVERDRENLYLDATVTFLAQPATLAWTRTVPAATSLDPRPDPDRVP
jgi:cell shape-determining protein MreC